MFLKNQLHFPGINTVLLTFLKWQLFYKNYRFSKQATGIPIRQDEAIIYPCLEIGPNPGFRTPFKTNIYEIPPFTIYV